eukprot:TRINITY_DN48150_c0_g1_i1.p1 TRINITY_DN48150_c0_g1~~TRINITY_DN48150_c0_g1_i1.p1  ORF type:complete len:755 (+),score=172.17 TRINITY_DN48150_c0_g1_i1:115-2379(+)
MLPEAADESLLAKCDEWLLQRGCSTSQQRSPPRRLPRLAHPSGKQARKKPSTAPHDTRFVRVPGGWRPRLLAALAEQPAINDKKVSELEKPMLLTTLSWSSLNSASSRSLVSSSLLSRNASREGLRSLTRPNGAPRDKRPTRRAPRMAGSQRNWPAKYIEDEEKKRRKQRRLEEKLVTMQQDVRRLSLSRGKQDSDMPMSPAIESSEASSARRTSVGRRQSASRRASDVGSQRRASSGRRSSVSAPESLGADFDLLMLQAKQRRVRGSPDAVEQAEEADKAAEDEGRDPFERRAIRLYTYSEALLNSPEIQKMLEDRVQEGLDLEDSFDDYDRELERLYQEELRELAALFVEFDGEISGFIGKHDLRSLLRRLGRAFSADEFVMLLDGLSDWDESDEELDFMEVLHFCDTRIQAERSSLRSIYREKFRGLGGSSIRPELRALAKSLEEVHIYLMPEQVRRVASEMELSIYGGFAYIKTDSELFLLAEHCRKLEKKRAHERAGFSFEQVERLHRLFERLVLDPQVGASFEDMLSMMSRFPIHMETEEEKEAFEEIFYCGRDKSTRLSVFDCLHAARRFLDKQEIDERLRENDAADQAGIPLAELDNYRSFYNELKKEIVDEEQQDEFSYLALSKGVRIMGATLTMEKNAELENLFRRYGLPSRSKPQAYRLSFSGFLQVLGFLFRVDFAGVRTSNVADTETEDEDDFFGDEADWQGPTAPRRGWRLMTGSVTVSSMSRRPTLTTISSQPRRNTNM